VAGVRPQAHRHVVHAAQVADLVFRHADDHFHLVRAGDAHDRRAGLHHLPRFGVYARHDAVAIRDEVGITRLVRLLTQLRARRRDVGGASAGRGLLLVEHGLADEVLGAQILVAFQLGAGQFRIRLGGAQAGLRLGLAEAQVLRVELHQHLSACYLRADFYLACTDLAADAKAQARFVARAHVAGQFRDVGAAAGRHRQRAHRPTLVDRRRRLGAGGERRAKQQHSGARDGRNRRGPAGIGWQDGVLGRYGGRRRGLGRCFSNYNHANTQCK
jgi:hypothetical protein